ncbi:peptidoglycan DD-metalloendopeptidase family protein [Neptunicella sp.]|uniref:peptidoglycan DD-metalloendopeptidase family protein n=1 Tax=Neptunicella sp. TaxID=2125986 RepID=UPI003F6925C0
MFIIFSIAACSSRPVPAPVANITKGVEINDYKAPIGEPDTYLVRQGDTLFSIAWFNGFDYRDLARINNLDKPYNIYPGQKIHLKAAPEQTVKALRKNSVKSTGQTSKIKSNQSVDPSKKQAYGKSSRTKNNQPNSTNTAYAARVGKWLWPAEGELIGSFSASEQGNKGIDIANDTGTPILAAADGKVVYSGDALRGYGKLIIIKHTEAYLTAYAHNSKILVKEQQWVKAGQKIALMGRSDSDRVKLHFEVRYKGKSVNPLKFLSKP